jgi:hypothetical protein
MRHSVLVSLAGVAVILSVALVVQRVVLAEPRSVAALTVRTAGAQEAIKVVGSTAPWTLTTTGAWAPVSSAAIAVPAGHTDLLTVDFFAVSSCADSRAPVRCVVHLRVGQTELSPAAGDAFTFDTSQEINGFSSSEETQAMSRFICLSGGSNGTTFRIYVEAWRFADETSFLLDDWTLRLTRSHGCATS